MNELKNVNGVNFLVKKVDLDVSNIKKLSFELGSKHKNLFIIFMEENNSKAVGSDYTWIVDPIDGTYDYINNLEEFTINAGLIINKTPVAGLIYAPSKKKNVLFLWSKLCF